MIKRVWSVTLTVADLDRAVAFYEHVLGLSKKDQFRDYAGFDCGGLEIGLKTWGELENPRQGEPFVDLLADNVDESYQALRGKGVSFNSEPHDTAWGGRMAASCDPDGNTLRLTQIDWPSYFAVCAT
jgi:catechol 2,3-dioxygenase-like lactoylglutathione lyase family enzyme